MIKLKCFYTAYLNHVTNGHINGTVQYRSKIYILFKIYLLMSKKKFFKNKGKMLTHFSQYIQYHWHIAICQCRSDPTAVRKYSVILQYSCCNDGLGTGIVRVHIQ